MVGGGSSWKTGANVIFDQRGQGRVILSISDVGHSSHILPPSFCSACGDLYSVINSAGALHEEGWFVSQVQGTRGGFLAKLRFPTLLL